MTQVTKSHYRFSNYSHPDRWASYFYQLREIMSLEPKNILEVGVGDKVLGNYLRNNTNISYTGLDIAADLGPDKIGSVTSIPYSKDTYDIACAFEVLEHLPFDEFPKALAELKRVSKKYVILSLPHFGPPFKFLLKIPLLPQFAFAFKIPYPKKHTFNGEHYWEIGKRGYPLNRILGECEKEFKVVKHFVPFENQYHHFFVLEKF